MVILEEGSFGSPIPTTYESAASPNCDPDPDDDDVIYCAWEDCGPSTITISRPCAVSSLFPFPFQLVESPDSEASLTEDLEGLPTSAVVPVGEYSVSLTFNVPQDNIVEEIETLDLKVVSGSIESELSIIIYDTPPFEPLVEEWWSCHVMNRQKSAWTSTKTRTSNIHPCPTNGRSTAWTLGRTRA